MAYVDETGTPNGKRGWQWVMVTPVVTVFPQGLSRSAAAAIELLGNAFGGIVVSDRFSAYNHLPVMGSATGYPERAVSPQDPR